MRAALALLCVLCTTTARATFWQPAAQHPDLLQDAKQGYAEAQIKLASTLLSSQNPSPEAKANAIALLYLAYKNGALDLHNSIASMIPEMDTRHLRAAQRHADILHTRFNHKFLNPNDPQYLPPHSPNTDAGDPASPQHVISSGTGTVISSTGLVLTAAHVIDQNTPLKFRTGNNTFDAELIKIDHTQDLALLRIQSDTVPHAILAANASPKLGTPIFTIGFPNTSHQGTSPKLARGEISGLAGYRDDPSNWQISLPLQPGNSGGALFDSNGRVVGVVVAKLNLPGTENVSYAVKNSILEEFLSDHTNELDSAEDEAGKTFEQIIELVLPTSGLVLSIENY